MYFPLVYKICDVSFHQILCFLSTIWDSCSADAVEIFWSSYLREHMAWFSWILGCGDRSPRASLFWSGTSHINIEFQSLPNNRGPWSAFCFSAGSLTGLEPFLLYSCIPCSSHRSRNPECLCLPWTEGPEGCSFRPFLTLLLFCFSTETFRLGLRPAMCFISYLAGLVVFPELQLCVSLPWW